MDPDRNTATENVFMFSGQGSQYFQMGRALFESDDAFRRSMLRLDETATRMAGQSVIETLYSKTNSKSQPFDCLRMSHPAIFMVEYSLAQCLIARDIRPALVLGASLGCFAAAAIAGYVDVEEALAAVCRQAAAVEACCERGGMIAVLDSPALYDEPFLSARSELAAVNFSRHFVVSARFGDLAAIESGLASRSIGYQPLPVRFAFHSRWMDAAKERIHAAPPMSQHAGRSLRLICCERATTLTSLPDDYFWSVVRRPIRFADTASYLAPKPGYRYIDAGPSGTLATLLRYAFGEKPEIEIHAVMTPYGSELKNLEALSARAFAAHS